MDDLRLTVGDSDVTQLARSIVWAGGYSQCARTLDVDFAVSSVDKRLPTMSAELGNVMRLYHGGQLRYEGFIFSRERENGGNSLTVSSADRGFYLKRNEASYKFRSTTPEAVAKRICADFGVQPGSLAETGFSFSRNFPGTTLYQIIQTGYTLAAASTGKRYMLRFRGPYLDVVTKERGSSTRVIKPGSNLLSLSVTESVESMVNRVVITDENDNQVTYREDAEAVALYGLMQNVLKQREGEDTAAEADKTLADSGLSQKTTVTNLGNPEMISGDCVVLREPVTGLYGLFWIDSDTHTWGKDGTYKSKLVLNFRNLMDEAEAGSIPDA